MHLSWVHLQGKSLPIVRDGNNTETENTNRADKQHMLAHHSLGRAKTDGIYYKLYKGITARAVLGPSNQHMHDPQVTATERRTLIRYRTGTLYNTKHAIRFGHLAQNLPAPSARAGMGGPTR
ncbi:MAG: hypothetical protein EOM68_12975 [Spirochaetia bacterium]|nr:hypothetical protein [Spirochaetia bacterium]